MTILLRPFPRSRFSIRIETDRYWRSITVTGPWGLHFEYPSFARRYASGEISPRLAAYYASEAARH